MKSKKELIEDLNQSMQRSGNLTVIHTNAIAHRIGLSATEFEAMDIIKRRYPITAGQLAKFCGLTTGAITGLVDRLERAGFVERMRDPGDRRKVYLRPIINKQKSKLIFTLYRPLADAFERCVHDLTKEELEFLIKAQDRMNSALESALDTIRDTKEL